MSLNVIKMNENTWIFSEGFVRFYLLEGTKRALMIDTGMETKDALEEAQKITKLPISLINTHSDGDHVGSNEEFPEFYMAPEDAKTYREAHPDHDFRLIPAVDGLQIDLGGRTAEVVSIPGHTPGSIAILDVEARDIYTGDPIQRGGDTVMFGEGRDMKAYAESMRKLLRMADRIERIYPAHGEAPIDKSVLADLLALAEKALAGEEKGEIVDFFGNRVRLVRTGTSGLLLPPED